MLLGLIVYGSVCVIVGGWMFKTRNRYMFRLVASTLIAFGIVLIVAGITIPFSL